MHWHKVPPSNEFNPRKRLGLVHVYTGEGKGKSTAALGLAVRAAGQQLKVMIIHFIKGHKDYGELIIQGKLSPFIEIIQFGTPDYTDLDDPAAMDIYLANQGMEFARKAMRTERPDVMVLDEINTAAAHGLVDLNEVLDFIDNKNQNTELILTGRDAPPELLNAADIVTVMTATRSPYDEDFVPRRGIEH
ncbi:MAG: cob(I)yrinic acid a,c-diamide adenosyltransferase [Candidatus Kerfeldbacteria bacterium]